MRVFLCLLIFCCIQEVNSQSISSSVIGTTGSSNEKLSFTTGETIIFDGKYENIIIGGNNENVTILQGFQQTEGTIKVTGLGSEQFDLNYKIYPNPAQKYIKLSVLTDSTESESLDATIFDTNGKKIFTIRSINLNKKETQFDISNLKSGIYLLRVHLSSGETLKTFRFVKMSG